MQKQKKTIELKKHVGTIHCANALSLLQRKIANALLYHAYNDLLIKEEHQIPIRDICNLIGYDSHDYKTIKRALVDLLSTVIEWNIIEEGISDQEEEWNASSIIADASIKSGLCKYSYSKRMRQLLYMPAVYGRLNMQLQAKFKSSYGLALYENVIRYQNLAQTPWFTLPVFRKLMGVQPEKYLIFRDFKRRVIDAAVTEVNTIATIRISADLRKELRNVVEIRFLISIRNDELQVQNHCVSKMDALQVDVEKKIKPSVNLLPNQSNNNRRNTALIDEQLSVDFGLNKQQVLQITATYDQEYILEKIKIIRSSKSFQSGKILNLAKYLISALAHDYQAPKSSNEVGTKMRSRLEQETSILEQQKIEQHTIRKDYEKYLEAKFQAGMARLSRQDYQEIETAFLQHIQQNNENILLNLYKKEGINNKMISIKLRNFIKENYPNLLS